MICLLHIMLLKLNAQRAVRLGAQGKDHQSAGDLVNPMYDPDPAELLLQQFDQIRRVPIPAVWQNRETRRFVYH